MRTPTAIVVLTILFPAGASAQTNATERTPVVQQVHAPSQIADREHPPRPTRRPILDPEPAPPRAPTARISAASVVVETFGGVLGFGASIGVGAIVGAAYGCDRGGGGWGSVGGGCLEAILVGGLAGIASSFVLVPGGVTLFGNMRGGRGTFGGAILGYLVGVGASALTYVAFTKAADATAMPTPFLVLGVTLGVGFTLGGPVAGYHLSEP